MSGEGGGLSVGMMTPSWPPGGTPNGIVTYVSAIAPALAARGHRVSLLTQHRNGPWTGAPLYVTEEMPRSRLRGLLERAAYRVAPTAAWRAAAQHSFAEALRRIAAEQRLDVLETEESFGWSLVVPRVLRTPLHVRLHGPWFLAGAGLGGPADEEFRWRERREGRAIAAAHAVSAPSREVLDRVRRHYGLALPDAVVIPNPTRPVATPDRWSLDGCDGRSVLFVGRFDRLKGGDLVVEAFALLARALPDVRLTIAGPDPGLSGDGGATQHLQEYLATRLEPAARERVTCLGTQPQDALGPLRRKAFVTVVPSRYESFGGTVAEAMAAGCPLVASGVGGIPELVEHGRNGLLHRSGDAADLAARLLELFRSPGEAARLGRQAAVDAERLRPELIAGSLEALYRRIVAVHPA